MSVSSKSDSSPIHNFIPSDGSAFEKGDEVRVGDVLHFAHKILLACLSTPNPQEKGTKPSSHAQAKHYTSTRFESPPFYLTKEVVETSIVVTRPLLSLVVAFERMRSIKKFDEESITKNVVQPLVAILLGIFEARIPSPHVKDWLAEDCVKMENSVELDIVMRWDGVTLPDGLSPDLEGLRSTIEMKTPRSCNSSEIMSFSKSRYMTTVATREIRDQVSGMLV